jgi:hypothetical protein
MPLLARVNSQVALGHVVSGRFVLRKIVPTVTPD